MYNHFRGKISCLNPVRIVLDVGGVGYLLKISLNTYSAIMRSTPNGWPGESAALYAHLSVSETAQLLYGFCSEKEREVFLLLISVSGVGCNTAINILSYMTVEEIEIAASTEDKAAFKSVKGIGDKMASQIVLDLKGKFKVDSSMATPSASQPEGQRFFDEAVTALIGLGFIKTEAKKRVEAAISSGESTLEGIIKKSLK